MYMKTVLLTSNSFRHRYIARCLAAKTDLQLIITEEKSDKIMNFSALDQEDRDFQKMHFAERERFEIQYFGKEAFPGNVLELQLAHGEINSNLILESLQGLSPDFIILFGTSIIKTELLQAFPDRFVNLHLGLSPWYKGSATNLFPLVDRRPEFLGATFHLARPKVDAGEILHQIRPELEKDDGLHDIGNKIIRQAGKILSKLLYSYQEGKITPIRQSNSGKICKIKDLSTEKLKKAYENMEDGMIGDYLQKKEEIDAKWPIISNLQE